MPLSQVCSSASSDLETEEQRCYSSLRGSQELCSEWAFAKPSGKPVTSGERDGSSAMSLLSPGGFVFEMSEPWARTLMYPQ